MADSTLTGKLQLVRTAVIDARPEAVWDVLTDARLLPEWVPAVVRVTACEADGERLGTTRTCSASIAGRAGTMVERCVDYVPKTRLAYVVDDESFGLGKMFDAYGFSLTLEPLGRDRTEVMLRTHYTPRNVLYDVLNRLIMRRRFGTVCDGIVSGLTEFVEERHLTTG